MLAHRIHAVTLPSLSLSTPKRRKRLVPYSLQCAHRSAQRAGTATQRPASHIIRRPVSQEQSTAHTQE